MSKIVQDLKINIKSKTWWLVLISAIVTVSQSFGLDLTQYIGKDWQDRLTTIFALLTMFGINLNLSESDSNVNQISQDQNVSTIDLSKVNLTVKTDNASASITVDNPESVQAVNNTVSATASVKPQ